VYKNGKTYWTATGLLPSEHGTQCKKTGAEAIFVFEIRRERKNRKRKE
jgi:hypothetical protein